MGDDECEEETKYSSLDHFMGLNGEGNGVLKRSSESISSLSSTTMHYPATAKVDGEVDIDEKTRTSRINDHLPGSKQGVGHSSDSEGSGEQRDGFDLNYRLSSREYLSPSMEKAAFSILFDYQKLKDSIQPGGSLDFMSHSGVPKTMSSRDKKHHAFADKLRMVQVNSFHSGAIWTMKFSHAGNYLCTAGQDTQVVVWSFSPKQTEEQVRSSIMVMTA